MKIAKPVVAVFDTKPYDRDYLSRAAGSNELDWHFHEFRLEAETASAAHNAQAVCVFVNDTVNREGLEHLAGSGVDLFRPIVDSLLGHDPFYLLADYQSYVDCQSQLNPLWADQLNWTRKSILNVAWMGKFFADQSIDDYCERIWNVKPVHVHVG